MVVTVVKPLLFVMTWAFRQHVFDDHLFFACFKAG